VILWHEDEQEEVQLGCISHAPEGNGNYDLVSFEMQGADGVYRTVFLATDEALELIAGLSIAIGRNLELTQEHIAQRKN
jgi:hypothetical protein